MQTEKQCRCGVEWFHCISTAQCWQHWACLWVSPSTLGKFPNTCRSSQQCFLDYHDCYVVDISQMTMHEISVEPKMQSTWKSWHQGIYLKLLSAWVGHFSTQDQIFFWKIYSIKKKWGGRFWQIVSLDSDFRQVASRGNSHLFLCLTSRPFSVCYQTQTTTLVLPFKARHYDRWGEVLVFLCSTQCQQFC